MKDHLEPCPFCGSIPIISKDKDDCWQGQFCYSVTCDNENCEIHPGTHSYTSKQGAMSAWNTRNKYGTTIKWIKLCPVCGEEASIIEMPSRQGKLFYGVSCKNMNCSRPRTFAYEYEQDAINEWNNMEG